MGPSMSKLGHVNAETGPRARRPFLASPDAGGRSRAGELALPEPALVSPAAISADSGQELRALAYGYGVRITGFSAARGRRGAIRPLGVTGLNGYASNVVILAGSSYVTFALGLRNSTTNREF